MNGDLRDALFAALAHLRDEGHYSPSSCVVHPDTKKWAMNPKWPAPNRDAVDLAIMQGTVRLEEAQEQGWYRNV